MRYLWAVAWYENAIIFKELSNYAWTNVTSSEFIIYLFISFSLKCSLPLLASTHIYMKLYSSADLILRPH